MLKIDKLNIQDNIFNNIKVAITPDEQQRGLMYQAWPPPIMIFPYKNAQIRKFWMKNTPSPLDIIFCNNNSIMEILHGEPFSLRTIGPDVPIDLVIEMPYGTVSKFNIKKGDNINIKYSSKTIIKLMTCGLN